MTSNIPQPLVSVVFVSYNRVNLLRQSVQAFRDCCTYPHLEFVLADDGSSATQQEQMSGLGFDQLLFSRRNIGMGANTNKGIRAAKGDYVFQIQDDFLCTRRCDFIQEGLEILRDCSQVGMVRFHNVKHLPNYRTTTTDSEMSVRLLDFEQPPGNLSLYVYCDSPQLKAKNFHETLGWYREDLPLGETEDEFCRRFLAQRDLAIAVPEHQLESGEMFVHIGKKASTRKDRWRTSWRRRLESSLLGRPVMKIYDSLPQAVRSRTRGLRKTVSPSQSSQ